MEAGIKALERGFKNQGRVLDEDGVKNHRQFTTNLEILNWNSENSRHLNAPQKAVISISV